MVERIKYESKYNKLTFGEKVRESTSAIPGLLANSGVIWGVDLLGGFDKLVNILPINDLNYGNYFSVGAGLYGGFVPEGCRKFTSLVTLVGSFTPEVMNFIDNGDIKQIGASSIIKIFSYGVAYTLSHVFGEVVS